MAENFFSGAGHLLGDVAGNLFDQTVFGQALQRRKLMEALQQQARTRQAIAAGIQPESVTPAQYGVPINAMSGDWSGLDKPVQTAAEKRTGMAGLDPVRASLAQGAVLRGNYPGAAGILDAARPEVMNLPDGTLVDKHTGQPVNRIPQRSYVNGFNVDPNADNAPSFLPKIADNATPLYDAKGNVVAQKLLDGTIQALEDSAAATARGTEGVKASLDMVSVPQADGSTRMMTRAQAAAAAGGGPGTPRRNGPPVGAPRLGGGTFGVSQRPADAAYQNKQAEAALGHFDEIQKAGEAANGTIASMQQINGLLQNFEGGKFSPTGLDIASALNSVGWKMDAKMANAQAADAIGKQLALQLRNPQSGAGMPGSMSNQDRNFLASMVPGLMQSAQGRQQLSGYFTTLAQRAQQRAQLARQWQDQAGRIDAADSHGKHFDDYWNAYLAGHPMFKPR